MLQHFSTSHSHMMYVPVTVDHKARYQHKHSRSNVQVICSRDFHKIDRWVYFRKQRKICDSLLNQIQIGPIDLIHTHYLFTAGGIAYRLKKTANTKYITAVRNADLNWFFRYAVHLRSFGLEILKGASKIIFISPSYRDQLVDRYVPASLRDNILEKAITMPNGVDDFWLRNRQERAAWQEGKTINLLYVGEFTKNKNIETIVKVTRILNTSGWKTHLKLIGDGPDRSRLQRLVNKNNAVVTMCGWIANKEDLLTEYRKADAFIMPSRTETFGLVFVEAMSQGLPIIYTKHQGIDGYFKEGTVGYGCDPLRPDEIAHKVVRIMENYSVISTSCVKSVDRFSWSAIDDGYEALYESVV